MEKKFTKTLFMLLAGATLTSTAAKAQNYSESFDDISVPLTNGWEAINHSDPGGTEDWTQGFSTAANQNFVFDAFSGATDAFIGASFNNTDPGVSGTISNWLLMPAVQFNNGDVFTFYTRTAAGSNWADRLQLRMSLSNTNNVGTSPVDTGDFVVKLLDIDSDYVVANYPDAWTQYTINFAGLPPGGVNGRLAFRYFVEDGGGGNNSFIIGIDDVVYTAVTAIKELNGVKITTYPNPVTEKLNINFEKNLNEKVQLNIYNALGKLVMNQAIQNTSGKSTYDVSSLSKGVYMIELTTGTSSFKKSFIKQ